MAVDILLGLQWGDEGKGKIIDYLAPKYDIIARFQGGPNAGHTLVINGEKTVLHTVPSGILQDCPMNVIGSGVVIDPVTLKKEIELLTKKGIDVSRKLFISKKAHIITPTHRMLDAASEWAKGEEKIGSTLRGISPTYMDKTGRKGLRVGDIASKEFNAIKTKQAQYHQNLLQQECFKGFNYSLTEGMDEWCEAIEFMRSLNLIDSEYYLNNELAKGKSILAEGAQGTMLDVDFGTYPYVTSSNTISAGACNGLGIAPNKIKEVIGIAKAYCTRVGSGPFPTELLDATGERIRKIGAEFGATTGRPRRCGWIDLPALKYAIMINGVTQIAMTKADVLNDFDAVFTCNYYEIEGRMAKQLPYDLCATKVTPNYQGHQGWLSELNGSDYESLPAAFQQYVHFIAGFLKTPITMVSTGQEREKLLLLPQRGVHEMD